MDWAALGLTDRILRWLEASAGKRAHERRLDPYQTSARHLGRTVEDLLSIRAGGGSTHSDPPQRIVDLKAAGLITDTSSVAEPFLSALGSAALSDWEAYGVATSDILDEPGRLMLLFRNALAMASPRYVEMADYWSELRAYFPPEELIDNWDALFVLNYLDYQRDGFAPGLMLREEGADLTQLDFDLDQFAAANGASGAALQAAEKIRKTIYVNRIPRDRVRALSCMALEIVGTGGQAASSLFERFGMPKPLPRHWQPFDQQSRSKFDSIAASIALPAESAAAPPVAPVAAPALPDDIDFSQVAKPPPQPAHAADTSKAGKGAGRRKVDHQKKAKADDEVGKLGEEFALRYERWRLRNHPQLLAQIRHVSLVDDSLGYDIESFEPDGSPRYVEVKGTLGPLETRFFLSANELAAATIHEDAYVILRTARLGSDPQCCEIRPPFDELEMTTAVFSVTFKPNPAVQP